jgi:hypothetical protein
VRDLVVHTWFCYLATFFLSLLSFVSFSTWERIEFIIDDLPTFGIPPIIIQLPMDASYLAGKLRPQNLII